MDAEAQKPFACKAEGCGMSFTNEDHLTVHEKKHDMSLNLGITNKGTGAFIADQTPTPTRLIKNCEEVGLFDDLKHVNPFDETFRRAVESKNDTPGAEITSVPESLNHSEDSLHTPQVFPQFEAPETAAAPPLSTQSSYSEFRVEKQQLILPDNITGKQKKAAKKCKPVKSVNAAPKQTNILPTPSLPLKSVLVPAAINLVPATQIIAFSIPATAVMQRPVLLPKLTPEPLVASQQPEMSVKDKLKAHLSSPKIITSTTSPLSSPKDDEPARKRISTAKSCKNSKRDSREVHDDCMERRRAAALRYRRKIKKEQTELKRRNNELVAENSQLKALVKQLKELLWAHQNCSVANSRNLQNNAAAFQEIVQPLITASKASPTLQIPIATPVKFIVQNDSVNNDIGTIIKIPVPSME